MAMEIAGNRRYDKHLPEFLYRSGHVKALMMCIAAGRRDSPESDPIALSRQHRRREIAAGLDKLAPLD
jgi:hypothetical protein